MKIGCGTIALLIILAAAVIGSLVGCSDPPAGPSPTPPTPITPVPEPEPPARDPALDALWLDLVFHGDRTARFWKLTGDLTTMPVHGVRDEHRADVEEVMELLSQRLFGRAWRPSGGRAFNVGYTGATSYCGLANIGAPNIWLADPCVTRIGRKAFRAVFAHEVAHTLGFGHDDALPGGLMNSVLDGANPPDRDADPLELEARVARCAFQHLERGAAFVEMPESC